MILNFLRKLMEVLGRRRVITDRTGKVPYLIRYYLFLKNRTWFPFNVTLHKILVSDEPTLHDHPWNWGAYIISGGYWEHIPVRSQEGNVVGATQVWRGPGSYRYKKAEDLHWLELAKDKDGNEIPCVSLFYMGCKKKEWGFVRFVHGGNTGESWANAGYRWVHNETYLNERENNIG